MPDAFVKAPYQNRIVSARWKEGNNIVLVLEPCEHEMVIHCTKKSVREYMEKYPIGYEWGDCKVCKDDQIALEHLIDTEE